MSLAPTDGLAERERNRALRRADWRYLLPDPAPRRALCLAGSALRDACAVVAGQVDDAPRPGVQYDLIVAEDPDELALRSAATALRADGACYVEWSSRSPGAAARARRAVEGVGLRDARSYRPWPSVDRCRAWVPTDGEAAYWWWSGAMRAAEMRRQQLNVAVGALQSRLGVHGRFAVVARGADAPAEPLLLALAREHGAEVHPSESTGMLLLTPGERAVGKLILLSFLGERTPAVAIKTARIAAAAHGLECEADLLDVVHAQHGGALAGAPRVLFRARALDTIVVGESALTGTPLLARLEPRRYESIAGRVTDWLARLAESAAGAPHAPVQRVAGPALDRFASEFGGVVDPARLARTRALVATLGDLPVVVEQRDCSPWNVFERDSEIIVLDWESGEALGVPALDLIYFATHAAYYLENAWVSGRFEDAYRAAWSRETAIGRVNLACAERYLAQLGLSAELLPALRVLTWVLHAHSDWVHRRDDAGGTPTADALRDSIFLRLYRTELETIGP